MNLTITPYYKDVFDENKPSLKDLLCDIPSKFVLTFLAMLNAELHVNMYDTTVQNKLLSLTLCNQPEQLRNNIIARLNKVIKDKNLKELAIFTPSAILHFMHYELMHFKEIDNDKSSPEDELNIFKAYLIHLDFSNSEMESSIKTYTQSSDLGYQRATWPTYIGQYPINNKSNAFTSLIKGQIFLNHFSCSSKYKIYLNKFLGSYGFDKSFNFLLSLMNIIIVGYTDPNDKPQRLPNFIIKEGNSINLMLDNFAVNPEEFSAKDINKKNKILGILSNPVFYRPGIGYIILDWDLLSMKLFDGLQHDFFEKSGIKDREQFFDYRLFKQYVSENITESVIFKKSLTSIFYKKYCVLSFNKSISQGFPDCYFRSGNKVALIKLKDASFSFSALSSNSFEKIKEEIDIKVNKNDKGTGQIIKQIKHLVSDSFENPKNYSHTRNFIIYPILIYTDDNFSFFGINSYLSKEFLKMIQDNNLQNCFKTIMPITLISLDFIVQNIDLLIQRKYNLLDLVKRYHHIIQDRERKYNKNTSNLSSLHELNQCFEAVIFKILPELKNKRQNYLDKVFDIFDLHKE